MGFSGGRFGLWGLRLGIPLWGFKSLRVEFRVLYRGYIGVMLRLYWENGKENGIYYLGFRVECRPMINKSPPSKGLNIRIPIMIPIEGRGFIIQGSTLGIPAQTPKRRSWSDIVCVFFKYPLLFEYPIRV